MDFQPIGSSSAPPRDSLRPGPLHRRYDTLLSQISVVKTMTEAPPRGTRHEMPVVDSQARCPYVAVGGSRDRSGLYPKRASRIQGERNQGRVQRGRHDPHPTMNLRAVERQVADEEVADGTERR